MTYICAHCGNRENFKRYDIVETEERVEISNTGEALDYDTVDTLNREEGNTICSICDSNLIEDLEEDDLINFIYSHTTIFGKWSKEALSKEELIDNKEEFI